MEPKFPTLSGEHHTQVAIIGGGITGLSVALELLQRGMQVAVLEAAFIGAGTTGGSSGHLDAHPEMGPAKLLEKLGPEGARHYVSLRLAAIGAIEHRAGIESDCVRVPAYYYTESNKERDSITANFEAAQQIGLDVEWAEQLPFGFAACGYRIGNMARMDSLAYVRRLSQLVLESGGVIFENTQAPIISGDNPKSMELAGGTIHFEHIVSAAHCNFTDSIRTYLQTPAYQSYVLAARVSNPPPDCLMWDTARPYFYTRHATSAESNLLLVGGCDHRTGAGDSIQAQADLEAYARQRYEVQEITSRWSAELFEPNDGLPIIGQLPGTGNVWIATGLSGIGLTWGTAAGWLLADQIVGRQTLLQSELSPSRLGVGGLGTMVAEQATSALDYAERLLPASKVDPKKLAPGEGKVGKLGKTHAAVCRTRDDVRHEHNPICVHMGGVVRWNEFEQTWDCPVHGGRYAADGTRIYGPPDGNLKPLDGDGSAK